MNIREAKEEILHTLRAYLRKDAYGSYVFPEEHQRPVLLMGPPGIGKTAVVRQAAEEAGIGFVSYTLTHHTRQSAIGLPKIVSREFDGVFNDVTEYTMSEIIASVYACMESTGCREGILFIDEINCVSETLVPVMLQFLQNKTFGMHRVPEGWVVVAAGNPSEYSRSVRELDIAVMDRVRRIELAPDLPAWLAYVREKDIHPAVPAYLELHPDQFYKAGVNEDGQFFVTARGWENLSELLKSYEILDIPVGEAQIREYLNHKETAEEFARYWRVYCKYHKDYAVKEYLEAENCREQILSCDQEMAAKAGIEERYTVVYQILDVLELHLKEREKLLQIAEGLEKKRENFLRYTGPAESYLQQEKKALAIKSKNSLIKAEEERLDKILIRYLADAEVCCVSEHEGDEVFARRIQKMAEGLIEDAVREQEILKDMYTNAFDFCETVFAGEAESLLLVTGIAGSARGMRFITEHGCPEFLAKSELLV